MVWRWLAVLCTILLVLGARNASAQPKGGTKSTAVNPPGSTPVLAFESDDAEDQADAFTTAFRNRLKQASGWTLSENPPSLGLLTAALKCRVDAPCLQRVGDQLKTDKFFWGRLARVGKSQVAVEAHYWQRGKHDSVVKETYSDDLRDPNNENLKRVASRVFERLTGTLTTGTVAVTAGRGSGTVLVDGAEAGQLAGGQTTLELKAGAHTIEVRAEGYMPVRQSVSVVIGAETQLTVDLVALGVPAQPEPVKQPLPVRRLAAYGLIGAGAIASVIGIVFAANYLSLSSDTDDLRKSQYGIFDGRAEGARIPPVNVTDPCKYDAPAGVLVDGEPARKMAKACQNGKDGESASTVAWVAGSLGVAMVGTGVVLLILDSRAEKESGGAPKSAATNSPNKQRGNHRSWSITPALGAREGSLHLAVRF
jgi:hypothetical protein